MLPKATKVAKEKQKQTLLDGHLKEIPKSELVKPYSAHSHFLMCNLVEVPILLALVTTIFWAQIRPQVHLGYTTMIVYGNLACAPLSHSGRSEIWQSDENKTHLGAIYIW